MGVIALALITTGHLTGNVKEDGLPFWVNASCALAIGLGTYIGGWLVIRTLGKGLVEIESPQAWPLRRRPRRSILSSSAAGMAQSTTHVATGSASSAAVSASPAHRCAGPSRAGWRPRADHPPRRRIRRCTSRSGCRTSSRTPRGRIWPRRPHLRHPRRTVRLHVLARPAAEGTTTTTSTPTGTTPATPWSRRRAQEGRRPATASV